MNSNYIFNSSKRHCYCLIIAFLCACNNQVISGKETPLSQQRENIKQKDIDTVSPISIHVNDMSLFKEKNIIFNFYYVDSLFQGAPFLINKQDNYLFTNSPLFLLQSDNLQTPIFLNPSEKIQVVYNNNRLTFIKQGDEVRTNELNFFKELIVKTGIIRILPAITPNSFDFVNQKANDIQGIKRFETEIQEKKKERIDFLNTYPTVHQISTSFKELAVHVISSAAIQSQLVMYWKNRDILQNANLYDSFVNNCLTILNEMPFRSHVYYLQAAMDALSMGVTKKYVGHPPANSNEFIQYYNFTQAHSKSELKNFLISWSVYGAVKRNVNIPESYITGFNKECTDNNYKNAVINLINDKNKSANYTNKGDNLISVNDTTIKDMQAVISKEKGNIILLDFWASWCSPCREEMPASAALKKSFEGKPVKFLYISTDNNRSAWLKANKEESLDNSTSFLYLHSDNAPFTKQYKINTIPRYILIGKDGKIINSDAPRPSDPKLKELIDKYIKG